MLSAFWVFFTSGDTYFAIYGVFCVVAATALSLALIPPRGPVRAHRWSSRLWYSLILAGWFVGQSVWGGCDVALRAIRPTVDIAPEVVRVKVDLSQGGPREFALLLMNLMPGTLVQRVEPEASVVELHTLTRAMSPQLQWEQLQRRVHAAFR